MFYHFHPYEPFLNHTNKRIIVGTLPPPRFCNKEFKKNDVDFCYGSKDNLLWQAFDKIFNLKLSFQNTTEEITKRKEFLIKNQIGICDIVESCKREKIDASDIGMREVILRDILDYLKEYKNIQTIIFTGGLCKNSPEYFFRQVLKKENIPLKLISENIPKKHEFIYDKRNIQTISLTSPSNAANRSIGANKYYKKMKKENQNYTSFDFRLEQYEKVFKELC
ncbi:MAG: uracil-DNA glycosylase family protein [Arcobacter sp.]|uniref:uracil-DNA glycosylase family protein n=1 Tax=Arcobacter sp. TaxID=1872629 RepID=UPI003AFFB53F